MDKTFDRAREDLGNSVGLEHLNLTIPDPNNVQPLVDAIHTSSLACRTCG